MYPRASYPPPNVPEEGELASQLLLTDFYWSFRVGPVAVTACEQAVHEPVKAVGIGRLFYEKGRKFPLLRREGLLHKGEFALPIAVLFPLVHKGGNKAFYIGAMSQIGVDESPISILVPLVSCLFHRTIITHQ